MKHLRTGDPRTGDVVTSSSLVRPIARRIDTSVEDFYAGVHSENIPICEAHQALAESHQWRRNWTTDLPPNSNESSPPLSPEIDVVVSFRENGARNPSPRSRDDDKKRSRSESIGKEGAHYIENDVDGPGISDISMSPEGEEEERILLRPTALRVGKRPIPTRVPKIIQDIPEIPRPISPMTFYSSTSSSLSDTSSRTRFSGLVCTTPHTLLQQAREGVLQELAMSGGETDSEEFHNHLEILQDHFLHNEDSVDSEGVWLTITKPTFFGCLGENDNGDPMYTLGRMSFDMFSPGDLVCSLQGNFNEVEKLDVLTMKDYIPQSLAEELKSESTVLRTYK